MAQLTLKRSNVLNKVPGSGDLAWGELALNYRDGKLYYKREQDSTVVDLVNYKPSIITATTSTTNIDFSLAYNFHITLQTNTQFTVSNLSARLGSSGNIILIQDNTGGRTFTKATEMKTPIGGSSIDQWTSANSLSVLSYYVVDANTIIVNYIGNFA